MTEPRVISERALLTAILISVGGNSSVFMLGSRGQDRVVEQLDRIAETLFETKRDLAAFVAGMQAELRDHARRLDKLESSKR